MSLNVSDILTYIWSRHLHADEYGYDQEHGHGHRPSSLGTKQEDKQPSPTTVQHFEAADLNVKIDRLDNDDKYYRHQTLVIIILVIGYLFIFIVGAVGNSLVVWIICKSRNFRTVTNFFILNLAVADLFVVTICIPPTLFANIFVPWRLGFLLCKVAPFIQGVTVCASVYSLVAISAERFLVIWFPLRCRLTKKKALIVIGVIWLWSLTLSLPWLLFFDLSKADPEQPDVLFCVETWPQRFNGNVYYGVVNLGLFYILPVSIISICYFLVWLKVWRQDIPTPAADNVDSALHIPCEFQAMAMTNVGTSSPRRRRDNETMYETMSRRAEMQMQNAELQRQKSKAGVLKMLIVVVLCFVVSWFPLYLIFTRIKLGGPLTTGEMEIITVVTPLAQLFGACNSCVNPILYGFFNAKFRRAFMQLFNPSRQLVISRQRLVRY